VVAVSFMADDSGKNKGFGFVSFEDSESAEKAVDELNGNNIFCKKNFFFKYVPVPCSVVFFDLGVD
jgi:RNA recognition motif-containing protein